jgi:hypothetical protein
MTEPPRPRRTPTWIVTVYSLPAEGRDWTAVELDDLAEKYGYGTEEYDEAVGPTDGAQTVTTYGPYTERQAKEVADYIAAHETVGSVHASPLFRYVPPAQSAVA